MSMSRATERSLLNADDFSLVSSTHHPALYDLDTKTLQDLQKRLRDMRGKSLTLSRQKVRESRGKAEPRGKSFPGTAEQPRKRKQIFASALRRVNKELERHRVLAARTAHIEAAHKALALHRSAKFDVPPFSERTANEGMQPVPNTRRRRIIPGSQVGSVSQATKVAQAIKDNRR